MILHHQTRSIIYLNMVRRGNHKKANGLLILFLSWEHDKCGTTQLFSLGYDLKSDHIFTSLKSAHLYLIHGSKTWWFFFFFGKEWKTDGNLRKFNLFGKIANVTVHHFSAYLCINILALFTYIGAIQITNMTNLLTFIWGTPRSLNLLICLTMLDLSHDIVLHVYTSNVQFFINWVHIYKLIISLTSSLFGI